MIVRSCSLVSILVIGLACPAPPKALPSGDPKEEIKEDPAAEARRAEIKKKREAEEAEKKAKEEARETALNAVAVLPEGAKLPKKLGAACQDVVEAHDKFMTRLYADDAEALQKWELAKGTQVAFTMKTCTATNSVQAAVCQKHALDKAPPELKEDAPELMKRCNDKYGSGRPAKGPALPVKRPG